MSPTKAVIIGCGAVLEHIHLDALRSLQKSGLVEVTAVVDPVDEMRRRALTWFPGANAFAQVSHALESTQLQVALIFSPPAHHVSGALECLAAGLRVFCEKPLATDAQDALRLVQHEQSDRIHVGMIRRTFSGNRFLRQSVAEFVDLSDFEFSWFEGGRYSWPISSESAFLQSRGGAGIVLDIGTHALDTIAWILGMPDSVSITSDASQDFTESNATLEVKLPSGRGKMQLSWTDPLPNGFSISSALGDVWLAVHGQPNVYYRQSRAKPWNVVQPARVASSSAHAELKLPKTTSFSQIELTAFLTNRHGFLTPVSEAHAILTMLTSH